VSSARGEGHVQKSIRQGRIHAGDLVGGDEQVRDVPAPARAEDGPTVRGGLGAAIDEIVRRSVGRRVEAELALVTGGSRFRHVQHVDLVGPREEQLRFRKPGGIPRVPGQTPHVLDRLRGIRRIPGRHHGPDLELTRFGGVNERDLIAARRPTRHEFVSPAEIVGVRRVVRRELPTHPSARIADTALQKPDVLVVLQVLPGGTGSLANGAVGDDGCVGGVGMRLRKPPQVGGEPSPYPAVVADGNGAFVGTPRSEERRKGKRGKQGEATPAAEPHSGRSRGFQEELASG
jgi:hypothetical protein